MCRYIKGPDFPTGGQILNSPAELKEIYKTGQGTVRLRATWENGPASRGGKIVYITSVPYTVNKAPLVERIGDVVLSRKMPHLVDVRDLSTDDVRIELELKAGADENLVMAYLFKHTPLQTNFAVNLTCLVPTENEQVGRPERLELHADAVVLPRISACEVVTSRLEHELEQLQRRIHILEGFEKVFDALDEIIRIIRKSDGKADAADKIMKRFALDAEQTDAILELKLYRLARLEILVIQNELADKRKRARQITAAAQGRRGALDAGARRARGGPEEVRRAAPDPDRGGRGSRVLRRRLHRRRRQRRHRLARRLGEAAEGSQGSVDDAAARGRRVLAAVAGSTRATVVFFTNFGVAYTARIVDVPASTGYGEPVQKLFKLKDGERVIAAFSLDPRVVGDDHGEEGRRRAAGACAGGDERRLQPALLARAVRRAEHARRPSLRAAGRGRRGGGVATDDRRRNGHRGHGRRARDAVPADEVNFLSGPGRGVILIKLEFPTTR